MAEKAESSKHDRGGSGDDARLDAQILAVCDAVGAFIEYWGFRAIHGRIWVLLAMHREPLAQSEIAAFFGVSRSFVSTAIAELCAYRLVKATSEHRNAPYVANSDVWSTITDVLRSREWMLLESARLSFESALDALAVRDGESLPHPYRPDRVQLLLHMTEVAQMLLRMLLALGGARVPRDLGAWVAKASELTRRLRR